MKPGSDNVVGIRDPVVDAMIEHVADAKSYDDLVAAGKALDRVLLWNHYVVPLWFHSRLRTARWDRFGNPDSMPKYGRAAFPTLEWWDASVEVARVPRAGNLRDRALSILPHKLLETTWPGASHVGFGDAPNRAGVTVDPLRRVLRLRTAS
jgi:hypothetical protein